MNIEQAQDLLKEFFPSSVLDIRVSADGNQFAVCAKSRLWVHDAPAWSVSLGSAARRHEKVEVVLGGFAHRGESSEPTHIDDKERVVRALLRRLRAQIKNCARQIVGETVA